MKAATLYLFAVGCLLAFCLAVHLLDEFRGDAPRPNDRTGDGESLFHSTDIAEGEQRDHV